MRQNDAQASDATNLRALWDASTRSQGIVIYDADGTILDANSVFLNYLDASPEDLVGRNVSVLRTPAEPGADWSLLSDGGTHCVQRLAHLGRDGRTRWLQSTFGPVAGLDGSVARILQTATDVSETVRQDTENRSALQAIRKSHGYVVFDPQGLILDANSAFLDTVGYLLDEIVGRHHRTFVEPSFAHSAEYALFWRQLAAGEPQAGQYRRFTKSRREVWLQASYNPVFDADGKVCRVVKLAIPVTEEKLRQAEHQGQIAAIHNSLCVISFDLEGTIRDANDNFLVSTGYRLSEIHGQHHSMFVDPAYAVSDEYRDFWKSLGAGRHQSGEFKRVGKHGDQIWLQATYSPILDLNGHPFRVVKYATVVTDQKLRQADLQSQIAAIDKSQGLISFDLKGTILSANANFCAAVGYSAEELVGQNHRVMVDPVLASSIEYADFWDTLRSGNFVSGLYKRIGKNGRVVWIQASYNPILDLNGRPERIIKFATDVTSNIELAMAYEDAKRQSQHDPGTTLPNRVRLFSFMQAILDQPEARLDVLYLDLDRFKPVNDSFGHEVGDYVLTQIADRLRRALRPDQLAARIGGDEFVIAAPNTTSAETEALCTRLIASISAPIYHGATELQVSVSIGVANSADSRSPDELLRCADAAMYRSKHSGRGMFSFYSDALNELLVASRNLSQQLDRGLADREFFLDYQPRFNTTTNAIASVEALVRWKHPERGLVPPLEFIPHAERSGAIVRLGEWVLRQACQDALGWPGIGISVNVSPVQFQAGTLVDIVAAVLQETGLDPTRLELEVTESVIIADIDLARTTLEALKQLGVRISMDDFGTGYSSFSNLRALPFDALKIDRQFIRDMDTRSGGREVVQAILALGKALHLSVTAEGVETPNQLSMLTTDQCSELQGFLLARPMPPAQITAWLERRNPTDLSLEPTRRTKTASDAPPARPRANRLEPRGALSAIPVESTLRP